MPKMQFSDREIRALQYWSKQGQSTRDIGAAMECSSATVSYWVGKPNGRTKRRESPRSVTRRQRLEMVKKVMQRRKPGAYSTRDAMYDLQNKFGIRVKRTTVWRDLRALGFKPKVRPRTTVASQSIPARVAFCRVNRRFDSRRIVFTDEKIFTTNDNTGRIEWCDPKKLASRRLSLRFPPGRVHIWAAIGVNFRCYVIFPEKQQNEEGDGPFRLTGDKYKRRCLQGKLVRHLKSGNYVLQQDGARAHWEAGVVRYLNGKGVQLLQNWPAHSPDLSPIETLWAHLAREVSKEAPTDRKSLIKAFRSVWAKLDVEYVNRLVLSFNKRCEAVLKKKGVQ